MLLVLCLSLSQSVSSFSVDHQTYRRHVLPGGAVGFLPRMRNGRNSKVMKKPIVLATTVADDVEEEVSQGKDVSELLADLKQQLAEVTSFDDNDLMEKVKQKERLPKENTNKFNIEQHNYNLADDVNEQAKAASNAAVPSKPLSLQQQPQQQFYSQGQQFNGFTQQQPQQQYINSNNQQQQNINSNNQQQQNFNSNNQQQQTYNQQQQFANNVQNQQQQFSQPQQPLQPRQFVQGISQNRNNCITN